MKKSLVVLLFVCMAGLVFSKPRSEAPDTVRVGTYIISVHDINFHEKEYTVRFWLWFLYDNANFDFSKQLDIPNAKAIEEPEIITDSIDGKAWVIMKMKCTMKENWSVEDFPFDEQHLKIQIENTLFDNKHLVFVPDTAGSRYDSKEAIDGWRITNFAVKQNVNDYETGFGDASNNFQEFSTFTITMDIERNAWGLFMKIFVGMYIAFLIAIVSFTPQPSELEPRFGLPVGGLFAAVGNKYIIDSVLPESSSFTLVDTLHSMTFFAIFMTLVVSALSLKLHDYGKFDKALLVNRIGAWVVISVYLVGNIIAIVLAIR